MTELNLKEWSFTTEEILPEQVTYGDYVPQKDRYFVGIEIDKENKIGTIYHDRELTEADIIHELLHVKYPKLDSWSFPFVSLVFSMKKGNPRRSITPKKTRCP